MFKFQEYNIEFDGVFLFIFFFKYLKYVHFKMTFIWYRSICYVIVLSLESVYYHKLRLQLLICVQLTSVHGFHLHKYSSRLFIYTNLNYCRIFRQSLEFVWLFALSLYILSWIFLKNNCVCVKDISLILSKINNVYLDSS